MNNVDLCALAISSGCKPVWADGILGKGWHCGCEDGLHCADSHCSAITVQSLQRKRHVRAENPVKIVGECAKCGHLFDICRNGFRCDACNHIGVKGARYADTSAYPGRLCTPTPVQMEPKQAKDVALLESWYTLEDTRS
jgi:ribosomal protein S14